MAVDRVQIALLLRRMALFKELTTSQIEELTWDFETVTLEPGEMLYTEGDEGDSFYIVYSGKLQLSRERAGRGEVFTTLRGDDFLGQETLLYSWPRMATARAVTSTELLSLNEDKFNQICERFPAFREFLVISVETYKLEFQRDITWLSKEETIYVLVRKDKAYLYLTLIAPVVLGWISVALLALSFSTESESLATFSLWGGLAVFAGALILAVWLWVDWTNDYYLVTNQRVIWLEKVVALYESRQEAPLDTILTVGINTNFVERLLGYGDIAVRTFTGQIVLRKAGRPRRLASIIEELLTRRRHERELEEAAALESAIRERLGFHPKVEMDEEALVEQTLPRTPTSTDIAAENPFRFLLDIFKVRYEEKGVVTYRKHWLLLLAHIGKPSLAFGFLLAAVISRLFSLFTFPSLTTFLVFAFFLSIGAGLWWLYEYVDWRNDIYQVTPDHIVDIYRKPLSSEDRKSAPLENILSLHHERKGLIGILLNFGNVVAMVGTTPFTFDGVYNPAEVQQDIFLRIDEYKRRQREAQAARERERIVDWLATYHEQTEAMRREENNRGFDLDSG